VQRKQDEHAGNGETEHTHDGMHGMMCIARVCYGKENKVQLFSV
jgi:hypothetical protein